MNRKNYCEMSNVRLFPNPFDLSHETLSHACAPPQDCSASLCCIELISVNQNEYLLTCITHCLLSLVLPSHTGSCYFAVVDKKIVGFGWIICGHWMTIDASCTLVLCTWRLLFVTTACSLHMMTFICHDSFKIWNSSSFYFETFSLLHIFQMSSLWY